MRNTHLSGVTGPLQEKEAKCICLLVASLIIISDAIGQLGVGATMGSALRAGSARDGVADINCEQIDSYVCPRGLLRDKHIKLTGKTNSKLASRSIGCIERMEMG